MLITIQFPICDARSFASRDFGRLMVPVWPLAAPGEFQRFFGLVTRQTRRGEPPDENIYARAHQAIKFGGSGTLGRSDGAQISLGCCFRRFHSNGSISARVEVGFKSFGHDRHGDRSVLFDALNSVLGIRVVVPRADFGKTSKKLIELSEAGPLLAKLYCASSTKKFTTIAAACYPLVQAGTPMMVIECPPEENISIDGDEFVSVGVSQKLHLHHCWVSHNHHRLHAWIVGSGDTSEQQARVRSNLLKFHAEQESVRHVLRCLARGTIDVLPGSEASELLQDYLNDAVGRLQRERFCGLPNRNLFQAAADHEGLTDQREREALIDELAKMRLNVARKMMRFSSRGVSQDLRGAIIINNGSLDIVGNKEIQEMSRTNIAVTLGNGATIHGDFVVANRIKDSFNKAANAPIDDALKLKLQELSTLVGQAIAKMPPAVASQASQDLQSLVSEVTSPQPRKRWYDLSAEGLLEAAKCVVDLTAPITASVKAVVDLLSGR